VSSRRATGRFSTAEIAAGIIQSRARISRDLALIDRDFGLRHFAVRAARFVQRSEIGVRQLSEGARHIVPLALIGIGLGWIGMPAGRDLLRRLGGGLGTP
jgi:hypothetical protein